MFTLLLLQRVKKFPKRVKRGRIMSPKVRINDENPSSHGNNENFEAAGRVMPESVLGEHPRDKVKDYESLKNVPWETRKEEANKPIYLIRYE